MVDPMDDDMSHQMLSTISDIRASDQAKAKSTMEILWLNRLFRYFPEMANRTIHLLMDWPGRSPNAVIITTDNKQRYRFSSDPGYDHGTLERI